MPTVEAIEAALRDLLADLDYDLHKGIERGEEDGLDHYPEVAAEFLAFLTSIAEQYE